MSWAFEVFWKATAVLGAGFALSYALRRSAAALRDVVWTLAFAVLLALPAVSVLAPVWTTPVAVRFSAGAVGAANGLPVVASWWPWVWMAGTTTVLLRLLSAHLRIARVVHQAGRLGKASRGIEMRMAAPGTMPMIWGGFRPVVLLPSDANLWPEAVRDSVLRHEMAHALRGDWWKLLLTQVTCAAYWFHPLAWLGARHALRAREQACDDAVLRAGTAGAEYAGHLLHVVRRAHPVGGAAAMPYCSELEGRIRAVLDTTIRRGSAGRAMTAALIIISACLVLPLGGLRLAAEEVHKVGGDVKPPRLIYKVEPAYTQEASDTGLEGTVVLAMEVSAEGLPENIMVTESLDPGLDASAVQAVSRWRFEPARKKDKPVRVAATVEVNFRLD